MSKDTGKIIRYLRDSAGYTTAQLAEKTGYSEMSITKYIAGRVEPPYEKVAQIAKACGYTVAIKKRKTL